MSINLNKVMLIGRLGRDPEVRFTGSGKAVANFSIATTETWNDKDGTKQEHTEWHKIVVWGKLGEICGEYLFKGKQVYIEGKLRTKDWQDRDGNKRYTTEIIASQMIMLGEKGEGTEESCEKTERPSSDKTQPDDGPEDDIPF